MSAQLIQSLLPHLPRFAEEEGDFYSVPRLALIEALLQEQFDCSTANACLCLLETLLDTLSVLDKSRLQNGEWCFVSFPAQLIAVSVLTAMSDADSRFFPVNFWNTQSIANDKKEQQRDVLKSIEQARYEQHATRQAPPIRFIYVAWSIVKLDGRILFYQREDSKKRFDKTAGDFGLLGGRANQHDISSINDPVQVLAALQAPNSELVLNALPTTLQRELREEAGLRRGEHYQFNLWRRLKPYRQVQGVAPNHALTEYFLDIFQIELTLEGFLFLQQRIASDERLAWLTLEDIARGESNDGKIPYIKALYEDFDGDRAALVEALAGLSDSFTSAYLSDKENFGVIFSIDRNVPVSAGKLGKDRPLDLPLNARQHSLVLGLAAHLRGFAFESLAENIVLHPQGWVEVSELSPLTLELNELSVLLAGNELVMESRRDRLFRLSIRPDTVFFVDELFRFRVAEADLQSQQSSIPVFIDRQAFSIALGLVSDKTERFDLTRSFARRLQILADGTFSNQDKEALSTEDNYKKGLHKEPRFKALGLRNLIRQDGASIQFVLPYDCQ